MVYLKKKNLNINEFAILMSHNTYLNALYPRIEASTSASKADVS